MASTLARALSKARQVLDRQGWPGLLRYGRKAAWERSSLRPLAMPWGPGHLQIEVSGKCNLKCPMCPRTFSDAGWENLSLADYQRPVRSSPGAFSVNLQGFGEPLLNPELEAIVAWTHAQGIEVGFATNATLLDERRLRCLLAAGLDWLNVSMDGALPSTFERIRAGASFERVVENARRVAAINRHEGEPLRLALVYVCMRSNLDEVPAFLDLARRIGIARVFLAPVLDLTQEVPAERLGPPERARLRQYRDQGLCGGLDVALGVFGDRVRPGELPCDWPWNKAYVTAAGKVTPCCIETESFLGDARADGIAAVWNGAETERLRLGLVSGRPHAICRKHCFRE